MRRKKALSSDGSELRRTELARRNMESAPKPQKRTAIKARSAKRAALMREARAPLISRLARGGVVCEIGPLLGRLGVDPVPCTGRLEGLHERRKRSSAGSLLVAENLIPACNRCNGWVEDRLPVLAAGDPERWAALKGLLVVREGDPAWDRLGSRAEADRPNDAPCSTCGTPYLSIAPCGHENRLS